MVTYTFTPEEFAATLDALTRSAARHESYVKFYGDKQHRNVRKNEQAAATMRKLHKKLTAYAAAESYGAYRNQETAP